jgi:hypothetical protein
MNHSDLDPENNSDRIRRVIRILDVLASFLRPNDCLVFILATTSRLPFKNMKWREAVMWIEKNEPDYDWELLKWGVSYCYSREWNQPIIKRRIRSIFEMIHYG